MNRQEIQDVVIKHLARSVDGIAASQIDPSQSMKDMGATSLDIVEVVSASMRELKVKVPRTELGSIKNLDGLVDLLHRVWTEKHGQATGG